jgi:hypothetical protein
LGEGGGVCFFPHENDVFLCFGKVWEYRVSDPGILKSIGVSVSVTGVEVSEDRVSDTEKSIGSPSLQIDMKSVFFLPVLQSQKPDIVRFRRIRSTYYILSFFNHPAL